MNRNHFLTAALLLLLSACSAPAAAPPATATAAATAFVTTEATQPPAAESRATLAPVQEAMPPINETPIVDEVGVFIDWATIENRTPDGRYERGNPVAPFIILDYSDFL